MRKAGLLVVAMVVTVRVATGLVQAQTAPQGTLDADNLNHQPTSSAVINSMFASGQTFNITRSGKLTGVRVAQQG
jgi:hypothetical protein